MSLQTGYLIKANGDGACILYYLTQVDPRGECPREGRGLTQTSPPGSPSPRHPAAQGRRGVHPSPGGSAGSWCLPRGWPCFCLTLGSCRVAAKVGGEPRVPVCGTEGKEGDGWWESQAAGMSCPNYPWVGAGRVTHRVGAG